MQPIDKDDLERAKLAVEEYKVLHAELLQRNNLLVQVAGASMAAIAGLVGFMGAGHLPVPWGIGLVVFVLFVLLSIWKIVDSGARNASKRIIEIEEYVNQCVGGDNTMPLSWERRFGLLKRDHANRLKRFELDRPQ